jgi:hypothetical protein
VEVSRRLLVQPGRLAASSSVLEVAVVAAPRQLLLHNIQIAKPTPDRAAEIKIIFISRREGTWSAGVGGLEASIGGHNTSGSTTRAQGPQVKILYLEGIY